MRNPARTPRHQRVKAVASQLPDVVAGGAGDVNVAHVTYVTRR
jgi:hypothetical protein